MEVAFTFEAPVRLVDVSVKNSNNYAATVKAGETMLLKKQEAKELA